MLSNYPDGHPMGFEHFIAIQVCDECGKSYTAHAEKDRAVNAVTIDDWVDECEQCGATMPDTYGYEPYPEYDPQDPRI